MRVNIGLVHVLSCGATGPAKNGISACLQVAIPTLKHSVQHVNQAAAPRNLATSWCCSHENMLHTVFQCWCGCMATGRCRYHPLAALWRHN